MNTRKQYLVTGWGIIHLDDVNYTTSHAKVSPAKLPSHGSDTLIIRTRTPKLQTLMDSKALTTWMLPKLQSHEGAAHFM